MGKKRINQLLDQLHINHEADLKNAAQIFTVAQVAVNQLHQQAETNSQVLPAVRFQPPVVLDQAGLKQRYGSFNECRKAARQLGIQFHRSPTWAQLVVAFSYFDALQNLVQDYTTAFPNANLHDVTVAFRLK
ncbi:hypothetical protein H6F86_15555 [Phormidium sp. FACHB-592]|uniref:Uncharacterized protein n=1 Tax=Stenomitos frigidus AS-A4 TaxID=2933935 RepID=A0ABV0KKN4_9CYAN|nr:hypothetical protein [Phormidium sp. FACHB-592]MBD2075284.1 hypothetical protein [Phormidium sp. FACHB-592]